MNKRRLHQTAAEPTTRLTAGGRIATFGLAAVLLAIVSLAIFVAVTTRRTVDDLGRSGRTSDAYDAAEFSFGQEESLDLQYQLTPSPAVLADFQTAADSLTVALEDARNTGQSDDQALVTQLLADHERYVGVVKRLFIAVDERNGALVTQIDQLEADPLFTSIQDRINGAADDHRAEADAGLNSFRHTADVILIATLAVTVVGLILVTAFWRALGGHQRRSAEAAIARSERETLRRSEAQFRSLVQNSSDMITVVDAEMTITYQSPSSTSILGRGPEQMIGTNLVTLAHSEDVAKLRSLSHDGLHHGAPSVVEARLQHADGTWRTVEIASSSAVTDSGVRGSVLNVRDVTEHKELEEQLRHQAFHDVLTGLANRARFSDRLEHELARARRHHKPVTVMFLDLDNFKAINDALGHAAGDEILVEVASRLRSCLRPEDTPARFGGDEFAVLVEQIDGAEEGTEVAARILDALRASCRVADHDIFIRASIGIASSDGEEVRSEELLRRADVAMYVAKERGKARYEIYEPEMQSMLIDRLTLAGDLQQAVERSELVVHYQPVITLSDQRVVGMEALVRWAHPTRGLLAPAEFITLAEETGLIVPIGAWVLHEACCAGRRWQETYPHDPPLTMAVNMSVGQLRQPGFAKTVAEALRVCEFPPQSLVLEITESMLMRDADLALLRLKELKEIGVRLAIDDFGTGYSSLTYLQRFPVDVLKIDKTFVDDLGKRSGGVDLARTMVELGNALHMEVIAEGIELPEQLERLTELNCGMGQGYLFSKPLDREAIDAFLLNAARVNPPRHAEEAA